MVFRVQVYLMVLMGARTEGVGEQSAVMGG